MIQVPSRVLVIIRSWLCVTLASLASAAPQGPTLRPTRRLWFTMPAPRPSTSPCVASPRLYCPTGQLTQKQVALGPQGVGWAVQTRRRTNGASASEHDRCQHPYRLLFSDMYRMSRIVYDILFTVYDVVKKSAISHTISGGGVPRRVLKLLYRSFFYDIVYDIVIKLRYRIH